MVPVPHEYQGMTICHIGIGLVSLENPDILFHKTIYIYILKEEKSYFLTSSHA